MSHVSSSVQRCIFEPDQISVNKADKLRRQEQTNMEKTHCRLHFQASNLTDPQRSAERQILTRNSPRLRGAWSGGCLTTTNPVGQVSILTARHSLMDDSSLISLVLSFWHRDYCRGAYCRSDFRTSSHWVPCVCICRGFPSKQISQRPVRWHVPSLDLD